MYRNIRIQLAPEIQKEPVVFDKAEVFGLNVTGFISVKVGNAWHNFQSDAVVSYSCEFEDEPDNAEFDDTNVVRLQ